MKKQILLVDDHPVVRNGVAYLINAEDDLQVCAEAEDASEALKSMNDSNPDMAIVDITLKGSNGIELIKQFKEFNKDIYVIVYSMHSEELYAERALKAGARGYVHKQEPPEVMLDAIRRVFAGKMYLSEETNAKLLEKSLNGNHEDSESPIDLLSDREFEVFRLIGQGSKPQEIAETLNLSSRTVENYRMHIREKLHLKNAADLTHFAIDWCWNNNLTGIE